MSISAQVLEKRDQILRITADHGARKTRIFGSVARGEDTSDSDIDFLVEFEPERSLIDHVALVQDLEDLPGRRVDVVTDSGLHWYIKERIQREAVPL